MVRVRNEAQQYRYERKFFVSDLAKDEIESVVKLHPAMFLDIYHPRCVNNIYFDSAELGNYLDNIDGLRHRVKVRIRWYGSLEGLIEKPVLELKIKKGLVGRKESFPLVPFALGESLADNVRNALERSAIPDMLRLDVLCLKPWLVNRYNRKYFRTANGRFRITIDSEMEFYQIGAFSKTLQHKSMDVSNTIVELKYSMDQDPYAEQITSRFPFRLTRSSKYVNGIERAYL